jgi:hypothetical protein
VERCQEEYLWLVPQLISGFPPAVLLAVALACPAAAGAQGLPEFSPLNPVASSRSGLYFQPLREAGHGRWVTSLGLDYASAIEYNQLSSADYVLDSEVLRVSLGASRDLGSRTFVILNASTGGAYAGFLDGFLDWYHGLLGIRMAERERRPRDRFLYSITLPGGKTVRRSRSALFLEDVRIGLGIRPRPAVQSVLSVTLPTATGPDGYGRGVASVSLLNTAGGWVNPRLYYEGSVGVGFTPTHGSLTAFERETFLALTSGFRMGIWGRQSLYANLFYHSPYYHDTTLPALDRRELSLDFGWIVTPHRGGEWRIGMTEDLDPSGPGVDLIFRFGRSF